METTEIRASQLRERMLARGVTQKTLAQVAGIYDSDLSAMLRGRKYIGPKNQVRIGLAIIRLGLDKEPEPTADEPVIRLRPL